MAELEMTKKEFIALPVKYPRTALNCKTDYRLREYDSCPAEQHPCHQPTAKRDSLENPDCCHLTHRGR